MSSRGQTTIAGKEKKDSTTESESRNIKITLIGPKSSGKTCVFNRYKYKEFGRTTMTVGGYFGMTQTKIEKVSVNMELWDTAGEEKFASLTTHYCKKANALIYVFDGEKLTDEEIAAEIRYAKQVIADNLPVAAEKAHVHFVINKMDRVADMKNEDQLGKFKKALQTEMSAKLSELSKKHGKDKINTDFSISECSAKQDDASVNAVIENTLKLILQDEILEMIRKDIREKIARIGVMKQLWRGFFKLHPTRRGDKTDYFDALELKLLAVITRRDINNETLKQCCRDVMSDPTFNLEKQKNILAGKQARSLLVEIDPTFASEFEAAVNAGRQYRFTPSG